LVELVWTPLNEALNLDLPKNTRKVLEGGPMQSTAATIRLRRKRLREHL
jgi:hypothetical protein